MGTHAFIGVVLDQQWRVAQFQHSDGYPEVAGLAILKFLTSSCLDGQLFMDRLRQSQWWSLEEKAAVNEIIRAEHLQERWQGRWPTLAREFGTDVLAAVVTHEPGLKLNNYLEWSDGRPGECDWCYVIDLDARVLEVHQGWQKESPVPGSRFDFEMPQWAPLLPGAHPAKTKLVKTWPLQQLPSPEEFIQAFPHD